MPLVMRVRERQQGKVFIDRYKVSKERKFFLHLTNILHTTFIHEPILMKTYMNANIITGKFSFSLMITILNKDTFLTPKAL